MHGVGSTSLLLTNPSVVLFALPIETTGWDEEQVGAKAEARRSSDSSGSINKYVLGVLISKY
jgi:hypothetical protein